MRFDTWLKEQGLAVKTARNYSGAITGPLSKWAVESGISESPLPMIVDSLVFDHIQLAIQELSIYQQRESKGKGMYSAALKKYSLYLRSNAFADEQPDIEAIYNDTKIASTEKQELVKTRLGQGRFRQHLVKQWKGCSVTGYAGLSLLVASHIKPWRESSNSERLDPNNGLLLLPNLDKAFDRGFISFSANGSILISPLLVAPQKLGISPDLRLARKAPKPEFLEYHRETLFLRSE